MQRSASSILALIMLAVVPGWARAHAVGVSCTPRGGQVEVEGYYDDDSPTVKAKVQVLNALEEIIASGLTDEKGRWAFPTPAQGKYEVRLDAGAGHRAKTTLTLPKEPATKTASDGPTRADFTGIPWLKLLIGLVVIGGCGGAFMLSRNRQRAGTPSPPSKQS